MAALAAKKSGKPLVVPYYSSGIHAPSLFLKAAWRLNQPVEKWSLKQAHRITTLSKHTTEYLEKKYQLSSTVIPPGVWSTHEHYEYTPRILFVGQLDRTHRWKGLEVLIKAVAKLRRLRQLKLIVVGDGDHRGYYQQLAEKCDIADIVKFKGRLDGEDLIEEYRRAGVLVLPSTSSAESFGMVLIEAMSCAVPVIASSIGGTREVVKEGTGLLVPPADAKALLKALKTLLSDENLARKLGETARCMVKDEYLWSNTAREFTKLYRDVIHEARHRL
jgi:glycosyltransferase involved in cell wall biosynthesis